MTKNEIIHRIKTRRTRYKNGEDYRVICDEMKKDRSACHDFPLKYDINGLSCSLCRKNIIKPSELK